MNIAMLLAAEAGTELPIGTILTIILLILAFSMLITLVKRYKRCPSNKILVVYGKTGKGDVRLPAVPVLRLPGPGTLRRAHRTVQRPQPGEHPRNRADDRYCRNLHPAWHHGKRRHPPAGLNSAADSDPGAGHHPGADARCHRHDEDRRHQSRPPVFHGQGQRGCLG